jgi:hypothetical protein
VIVEGGLEILSGDGSLDHRHRLLLRCADVDEHHVDAALLETQDLLRRDLGNVGDLLPGLLVHRLDLSSLGLVGHRLP